MLAEIRCKWTALDNLLFTKLSTRKPIFYKCFSQYVQLTTYFSIITNIYTHMHTHTHTHTHSIYTACFFGQAVQIAAIPWHDWDIGEFRQDNGHVQSCKVSCP